MNGNVSLESIKSLPSKHIESVCKEYYKRLIDFGVVHSSVWLRDNLKDEEVAEFKAMQVRIAKRYGL